MCMALLAQSICLRSPPLLGVSFFSAISACLGLSTASHKETTVHHEPKKPRPPVMPPAEAVAGSLSFALVAAIMLAAYVLPACFIVSSQQGRGKAAQGL